MCVIYIIKEFKNSQKTIHSSLNLEKRLQSPTDIQLTRDNIYVLFNTKPFLIIFNYNFTPVQNIISNSISNFLKSPFCFIIDGAGNIIISDQGFIMCL